MQKWREEKQKKKGKQNSEQHSNEHAKQSNEPYTNEQQSEQYNKPQAKHHHQDTKHFKSPLRYPGGKTRGVQQILQYFPKNIKRVCSPFLGGGSLELALAQKGIEVFGYDNFEPLTNFWQQLLKHPKTLAKKAARYYPLSKQQFYKLQKEYDLIKGKTKQAAAYFALNRASFSGTTFTGGMSLKHPRFTIRSIEALKNFKAPNLHVELADFTESIKKHKDDFLYLDPPYYNKQMLYGKKYNSNKNFDHAGLAKMLKQRSNWILSYNDCGEMRELYKGYKIIKVQWYYGMNQSKHSLEILIMKISD